MDAESLIGDMRSADSFSSTYSTKCVWKLNEVSTDHLNMKAIQIFELLTHKVKVMVKGAQFSVPLRRIKVSINGDIYCMATPWCQCWKGAENQRFGLLVSEAI